MKFNDVKTKIKEKADKTKDWCENHAELLIDVATGVSVAAIGMICGATAERIRQDAKYGGYRAYEVGTPKDPADNRKVYVRTPSVRELKNGDLSGFRLEVASHYDDVSDWFPPIEK